MTRIKICGLFREADIDAVNAALPDYVGFVFAPSRRQVSPAQAGALRSRLDPAIVPVGVFVNAPVEWIVALFLEGTIALAQLHGSEDESVVMRLKQVGLTVIKAVRVVSVADIQAALPTAADFLLLDGGSGGTGQTFDWRSVPPLDKPFFLAGGIGEHNLEAALSLTPEPFAIDISSGAETDGLKDRSRILRLVHRAHEARSSATTPPVSNPGGSARDTCTLSGIAPDRQQGKPPLAERSTP